ncbi:hypothetical protein SHO565_78270 [Streptomyces sp. HO565]
MHSLCGQSFIDGVEEGGEAVGVKFVLCQYGTDLFQQGFLTGFFEQASEVSASAVGEAYALQTFREFDELSVGGGVHRAVAVGVCRCRDPSFWGGI